LAELIRIFQKESRKEFTKIRGDYQTQLAEVKTDLKELNRKIDQLEEKSDLAVNNNLSTLDKMTLIAAQNDNFQNLMELKSELRKKKYELQSKLQQLEAPELIDQPIIPQNPIKPNKKLNLAISAVLGLMLGITAAFCVEFLQDWETEDL